MLALNKVDRVKPDVIMQRIVAMTELLDGRDFAALVPISATTGDGVAGPVSAGVTATAEGNLDAAPAGQQVLALQAGEGMHLVRQQVFHASGAGEKNLQLIHECFGLRFRIVGPFFIAWSAAQPCARACCVHPAQAIVAARRFDD